MKTQILYEDKDILVIYKPAGLAVQSAAVTQQDVVSELCSYLGTSYVGLVHRLDQPVEGILAVAKTRRAAGQLGGQIGSGQLKKFYYAVVCTENPSDTINIGINKVEMPYHTRVGCESGGTPLSEKAVILTDYMRKDKRAGRAQIVPVGEVENPPGKDRPADIKKAVLSYRLIERHPEYPEIMLADICLQTGRFHQIRAQMAHADMSLLGDQKYACAHAKALSEKLRVKHVALCACKLIFLHPTTKREMTFEKLPQGEIFQTFIKISCNIWKSSII